MAKPRASPGSAKGTPGKRKRSPHAGSRFTSRHPEPKDEMPSQTDILQRKRKSQSPERKRARFEKGDALHQGPTVPGRSPSPARSALKKNHDDQEGHYGDSHESCQEDVNAQLQGEMEAASRNPPRLKTNKKTQLSPRQRSQSGPEVRNVYPATGLSGDMTKLNVRSPSPATRGRKSSPTRPVESSDQSEDETDSAAPLARSRSPLKQGAPVVPGIGRSEYDDICEQVNNLRDNVKKFAESCPTLPKEPRQSKELSEVEQVELIVEYMKVFKKPPSEIELAKFAMERKKQPRKVELTEIIKDWNEQLVRYIGCIAQGGGNGEGDWTILLTDQKCRQALVLGVIGRALKEHVFNHLYFGGSEQLLDELSQQEKAKMKADGFARSRDRARAISRDSQKSKKRHEDDFHEAVALVAAQLETLIRPFWNHARDSTINVANLKKLGQIVKAAGELNRSLRSSTEVVYYWPPTFKDEEFEPARMECFNLKDMISTSPYKKVGGDKDSKGPVRAVLDQDLKDAKNRAEAIVRVVCFPGLVAYRQHGGHLAERELEDEENERRSREGRRNLPKDVQRQQRLIASREPKMTGGEGFRTCVISKSVVLLQWGKQRLLTKEAGTSRHIDAMKSKNGMKKYEENYKGFVELYDVYKEAKLNPTIAVEPSTSFGSLMKFVAGQLPLFSRPGSELSDFTKAQLRKMAQS